MFEDKERKQKHDKQSKDKKHVNPGDIKGKIDVHDTRERRDGPGGN